MKLLRVFGILISFKIKCKYWDKIMSRGKCSQDIDWTRRPLPPRHCGAVRQQNYSTIVLLFWCTVGSVAWWLCNVCGVSGSRSRLSCVRGGRPEICIQHRGGQSVGRRSVMFFVLFLSRLCSPRCWMATHNPCPTWYRSQRSESAGTGKKATVQFIAGHLNSV